MMVPTVSDLTSWELVTLDEVTDSIGDSDMCVWVDDDSVSSICKQSPQIVTTNYDTEHLSKENDPNWNTLALLYEKPSTSVVHVPFCRPSDKPSPLIESFLDITSDDFVLIFVEDTASYNMICPPLPVRDVSRYLMQRWLDTSMRHERWWLPV